MLEPRERVAVLVRRDLLEPERAPAGFLLEHLDTRVERLAPRLPERLVAFALVVHGRPSDLERLTGGAHRVALRELLEEELEDPVRHELELLGPSNERTASSRPLTAGAKIRQITTEPHLEHTARPN